MKIYSIITKKVVYCIGSVYIQVKNVTRLVYCHLLIDYLWKRSNVSSEGPSLKRKHDNSDKGPSLETLDLNLVTFLTSIIMFFYGCVILRGGSAPKLWPWSHPGSWQLCDLQPSFSSHSIGANFGESLTIIKKIINHFKHIYIVHSIN